MKEYSAAALVYGNMPHHIDHLVPLCDLLDIPLIVTEEELLHDARHYYPFITTHLLNYNDSHEKFVEAFDIILCSTPRLLFDEIFSIPQRLLQKKVHTIWAPHGNSDKGHSSYFMTALKDEEVALVYGKKMIDFLIEKGAYAQLKEAIQIGNLRYAHYLKHKDHYDALVKREIIAKLPPAPRNILYAPTWQDVEKNSSFFDATTHLIENLPAHTNLIIQLHPNTSIQDESALLQLPEKNNILNVKRFYISYGMLNFIDLYIGDMSSLGYDALTFENPLFFLNNRRLPQTDPALYLTRCGTLIDPEDYPHIYEIIDAALPADTNNFKQARKEVYDYTFGRKKDPILLKKEIESSYSLFQDSDLPLL